MNTKTLVTDVQIGSKKIAGNGDTKHARSLNLEKKAGQADYVLPAYLHVSCMYVLIKLFKPNKTLCVYIYKTVSLQTLKYTLMWREEQGWDYPACRISDGDDRY